MQAFDSSFVYENATSSTTETFPVWSWDNTIVMLVRQSWWNLDDDMEGNN